ncbi:MAG: SUMF1/EgtB/PvdO family nonheme iron enzyme [Propionivibrio sp.]
MLSIVFCSLLILQAPLVHAAKRIAFVIGNANYASETPLKNPLRDVALLAGVMRQELGFDEVIEKKDLTRAQLFDLVNEIGRKSKGADAVVVYYSGHGMRGPGGNYLIPVDARISEEEHVRRDGIAAGDLVEVLKDSNARVALLILDACRDSPYTKRSKGTAKGLTRMNVNGGNILVAYATTENNTADDGAAANSPYARALAENLRDRTKPLLAQLDGVRRQVRDNTAGKQNPTREGDLEVNVYLINPTITVNAAPPPARGHSEAEIEQSAWEAAQKSATTAAYGAYLQEYPKGRYASAARVSLAGLQPPAANPRSEAAAATAPVLQPAASAAIKPGQVFKDCADCPEMVVIPSGKFTMGSSAAEQAAAVREGVPKATTDRESPQHEVSIGMLAVGKSEVTRGEFSRFIGASGYRTEAETGGGCYVLKADGSDWEKKENVNWKSPGFEQSDEHPVVCVSWNDAKAYVKWLGEKTKKGYRLLSESEWEYAARAGSNSPYPWGEDKDHRKMCKYANHRDKTFAEKFPNVAFVVNKECSDGRVNTAEVKHYLANDFGLYNMIGNVYEWVEDCFYDSYNGAPKDGSAWASGKCEARVLRGGSWYYDPANARAARRDRSGATDRDDLSGFRPARMLP